MSDRKYPQTEWYEVWMMTGDGLETPHRWNFESQISTVSDQAFRYDSYDHALKGLNATPELNESLMSSGMEFVILRVTATRTVVVT